MNASSSSPANERSVTEVLVCRHVPLANVNFLRPYLIASISHTLVAPPNARASKKLHRVELTSGPGKVTSYVVDDQLVCAATLRYRGAYRAPRPCIVGVPQAQIVDQLT